MSSTPLFDAASISMMSMTEPESMPLQISHSPQGSGLEVSRQLTALAKILAQVVLPVPRVPVNRYAWPMRPAEIWFCRAVTMAVWPTTSAKRWGRHFRYRARYIGSPPAKLQKTAGRARGCAALRTDAGLTAALGKRRLMLLGSPPDMVHRLPTRGTCICTRNSAIQPCPLLVLYNKFGINASVILYFGHFGHQSSCRRWTIL